MLRRWLAWLLSAELEPCVDWSECVRGQVIARIELLSPRLWSGTETLEQVLIAEGERLVLLKRWHGSGRLARCELSRSLHGTAMRLMEYEPGPPPLYRLQLSPVDGASRYAGAWPSWFGLWRNVTENELGAGVCFLDSGNRDELKELRRLLLGGQVPESLATEEAMWEKMNALSTADRQPAMAALVTQSLGEVDRRFREAYPEAGPVPESLQDANAAISARIAQIQQTAASRPVDPELEKLMQRFVHDATRTTDEDAKSP